MGGRILFVLIAVIVLGALLYAFRSGTVGIGSLLPHFPTSSPSAVSPSYIFPVASPGTTAAPAPTPTSSINPADVPQGFTASQLSPYFHQVRFGGISPGSFYSYGYGYGQISLYAYPAASTSSIDVTGWQIKSNRGGEYIPQAVDVYDPLGLSPATDIRLKSGDVVNLYSTSAPVNLRLNECIGYLPNKSQFNPQLPLNCPYLDRSQFQSFSGACQNYITSLSSCQSPNLASPYVPQNDYACVAYLENHFNYHSCFDEHNADSNFLSNEVRVWTGSSPVDPFHDRVLLLDRNGLLVDIYNY